MLALQCPEKVAVATLLSLSMGAAFLGMCEDVGEVVVEAFGLHPSLVFWFIIRFAESGRFQIAAGVHS